MSALYVHGTGYMVGDACAKVAREGWLTQLEIDRPMVTFGYLRPSKDFLDWSFDVAGSELLRLAFRIKRLSHSDSFPLLQKQFAVQ